MTLTVWLLRSKMTLIPKDLAVKRLSKEVPSYQNDCNGTTQSREVQLYVTKWPCGENDTAVTRILVHWKVNPSSPELFVRFQQQETTRRVWLGLGSHLLSDKLDHRITTAPYKQADIKTWFDYSNRTGLQVLLHRAIFLETKRNVTSAFCGDKLQNICYMVQCWEK